MASLKGEFFRELPLKNHPTLAVEAKIRVTSINFSATGDMHDLDVEVRRAFAALTQKLQQLLENVVDDYTDAANEGDCDDEDEGSGPAPAPAPCGPYCTCVND